MTKDKPINANTAPKDQLGEMRRVLRAMNDAADRAADEHVKWSTNQPDGKHWPVGLI